MTSVQIPEAEVVAALEVARELARAGIPVFVAGPDPSTSTGFRLPYQWEQTAADPAVVDEWRPGMALCAVMGHGLDVIDVDPRNGGDPAALGEINPISYGLAATPSDGVHSFIVSLGVAKHTGVFPGIDVQAGAPDGSGRGFVFLPPTVKPSKVTGEPTPYRWVNPPNLDALRGVWARGGDGSGERLAARIRGLRAQGSSTRKLDAAPSWWREFLTASEPQSEVAAQRAVSEKLAEVRAWQLGQGEGFRAVLMRAAMTLGGYVGGGWLDATAAWDQLEAAAAAVWGVADEEDRRWIEQGLSDGAAQPFRVYTVEDERRTQAAALPGARYDPVAAAWSQQAALGIHPFDPVFAVHDQEHAEAVLERNGPIRRYGVDSGTWLVRRRFEVWTELPAKKQANAAVAAVARLMPPGETPVPKKVEERTPAHWQAQRRALYLSSAGAGRIGSKIEDLVISGDHPVCIDVADLDAAREVFWAGGYPFDLRASRERPTLAAVHPDTPHLHTAACAPVPEPIATPAWDAFVAAVFPDPEVRAWALRVLSIALTGYPDAALPVLYGPERTGKTSLVELLVRVLGTYGHAADPRLLGDVTGHASVVYALKGRRLSFIDEGPRRGHLAAERLKQLTGGATLTGNAMRANPVSFSPTHTLVLTTNDEPPITDPALRARLRIIPCEADQQTVRAARQAITDEVWDAEAPGVLAMLMSEAAAWLADQDSAGIAAAPGIVRELVGDMAATQDPVREWREMATVPADPGTPGRELYRAFVAWFDQQPVYRRQSPPSETAFGRSLTEQGFPPVKWDGRWHRALSVLNPGGGLSPMPTASSFMTGGSGGSVAGSGGLVAGSQAQPATTDNPRSDPLFSTTSGGLAGLDRPMKERNNDYSKWSTEVEVHGGNREQGANPPPEVTQNGGLPAQTPVAGNPPGPATKIPSYPQSDNSGRSSSPSPSVSNEALDAAHRVGTPDDSAEADPEVAKRAEASRLNREIARLHETTGRAKTELRKEIKAAQKVIAQRSAVAAAGGEVHPLPVALDRAGHVLPVSLEQAVAVVRTAIGRTGGYLTVDVEHSGYPVGHQLYRLRSVQLGDEVAVAIFDPHAHADTIRELLAAAPALVAHSATADLVPLAVAGLLDYDEAWNRTFDTVLPAKLADPASTGSDPGLKKLAPAVLGDGAVVPAADEARAALFKAGKWLTEVKTETPVERSGWAQVDTGCETMLRYAGSDVLDTAALAMRLPAIDPAVLERERLAQRMTARVTYRGVRLDPETVAALTARHTTALGEVRAQVQAFGIDNPGSDPQVGAKAVELGAQLPRTPGGKPSVAAGVLESYRDAQGPLGAFVTGVLDYRHHETVLGLFLEPYRQLIEHGDGRARPTVYTIGTNTGRMSCTRPNLQQLPKKGGVRACITADPGQVMISADFSSVEIRVAAALSGDPTLQRMIAEGRDLHEEIALQVWGADPEASAKAGRPVPAKAYRYKAKGIVFGRIYGGGLATLSAQVGVTQDVGQAVLDTLDAMTPQLKAWSRDLSNAVQRGLTQFPSYSGRIIHMPAETPHAAGNYAIQGTARELLVDALHRWADTRWGTATLIPVHDELDVFVPADDGQAATATLVEAMSSNLHGVPIVASADDPSPFWTDAT